MARTRPAARPLTITAVALSGVAVLAAAGLAVAWFERREIGLRLATDYLRARGVPATLHIERLDAGGVWGALVLGDPVDPDLRVAHVEVEFAPLQFGFGGVAAPRLRAVRLVAPVLKGRLDARGLRFGTLQRMIDDGGRGAAGPPIPLVTITNGRLDLATSAGPIRFDGDGVLRDGRIASASVRLPPATLAQGGVDVRGLEGELHLTGGSTRLHARWRFAAAELGARAGRAQGVETRGDAEGPYPDDPSHLAGPVALTAVLRSHDLTAEGTTAHEVEGRVGGAGRLLSRAGRAAYDGDATARLTTASARLGAALLDDLALDLRTTGARFDYRRPAGRRAELTIDAPLVSRIAAALLRDPPGVSGLTVRTPRTHAKGRVRWTQAGLDLRLDGETDAQATLAPARVRRLASQVPAQLGPDLRATIARNLAAVRLTAPAWRLAVAGRRAELRLVAPARAVFAAGERVEIEPRGDALFTTVGGSMQGAFTARAEGSALPTLALAVAHWSNRTDLATADSEVDSTLALTGDAGAMRGIVVHAQTHVARRGGALTVRAPTCIDMGAAAVGVPGAGGLRAVQARLCPTAAPLFALNTRGWSAAGRLEALQASAPLAGMAVSEGEGAFNLQAADAVRGEFALTRVRLADVSRPTRVEPLVATGTATLARGGLAGALRLDLAAPASSIGRVDFSYDPAARAGAARFVSSHLRFTAKGLQPSSLAPAAVSWASAVEGGLDLDARVGWKDGRLSSSGEVRSTGLDLQTPAGRVHGLKGDLRLASLYPLATASPQRIRAQALDTPAPLTDLVADVELDPRAVSLRRVEASLAGGRLTLDPVRAPLAGPVDLKGVVRLAHVDFGRLLTSFGLADSVALQATMSGAVPFAVHAGAVSLAAGRLAADGPGRLTIRREALGGAVATAGAAGAQPNAVQDFAYQALENLAFDALDAEVDSLPKGRLGVVLHVHGRHDPAHAAPTRVRLVDLVAGRAFDKPLPLPKGTGVELTLDTSLNFDELLADYGALRASAGSATVQPPAPR